MWSREAPTERSELTARLDERFRAPLMAFFLRRVGDRAAAEDLTHDTFVRLLAALDREPVEDAGALLFRIAANLLKDRARKEGRRAATQLVEIEAAPVSALTLEFVEDVTPERVLIGRERIAIVASALDELGQRTRDIYVLFRLENMKQQDIADLYAVSKSTVEKELARAAVHIAKRLGRRTR